MMGIVLDPNITESIFSTSIYNASRNAMKASKMEIFLKIVPVLRSLFNKIALPLQDGI